MFKIGDRVVCFRYEPYSGTVTEILGDWYMVRSDASEGVSFGMRGSEISLLA